jgi:hypothetical protein
VNPTKEDVMQVGQTLAVFAMTAAEQRRVLELTAGCPNYRVQITRFEVPEGEDVLRRADGVERLLRRGTQRGCGSRPFSCRQSKIGSTSLRAGPMNSAPPSA